MKSFWEGEKLTNEQRMALLDMSYEIMDIYREQEGTIRETILNNTRRIKDKNGNRITDNQIVPNAIFGESTPEAVKLRELQRKVRRIWPTDKEDIENFTLKELEAQYSNTLRGIRGEAKPVSGGVNTPVSGGVSEVTGNNVVVFE